ncbi:PREDICTED: uncharacterized protein LOC109172733 [Ipomoea nil]|uniref:uncharacterized protein LOC109172733 n=1 Tax=Ipomoea nil TaxID=35883 RepID=UPI00090124E7|nr:PREDICTED: uncharacterized protein LOC109172733 [Ipomoea nil]
MGEEHLALGPSDRAVEQAIVVLKKGAHLLKYGRIGKPKFCPFRLSQDEKYLIWYSGEKEKQLRLSSVTNIIHGQNPVNLQKLLKPERESQCISLVYANGQRSLDLICKDKMQAESWFLGLRAVISSSHHKRFLGTPKSKRGVQSCISSPASYMRRRQNLGLYPMDSTKLSKVRSLAGSPDRSFSERGCSDGLSCSSDSFFSELSMSSMHNALDAINSGSPYVGPDDLNKRTVDFGQGETQANMLNLLETSVYESTQSANYALRDVFIWGEGVEGGFLEGGGTKLDALLPKVLDSTVMLDVQMISLGRNHACLATKQGEVFSWGEAKHGRLGHKVDIDSPHPKIVDSLDGIHVKSVSCSEYQTCALTASGEIYTWGDDFSNADYASKDRKRSHWLPHKVLGLLDGVKISSVACGEWHTAMVSTSGQLFTYGDGTFGALGHGNNKSVVYPKEVKSLEGLRVKSVACGSWHTAAIVEIMAGHFESNNSVGKLFTWGDGDKGRLGHSDQDNRLVPTCVARLVEQDFVQVSCGRTLTVVLSSTGKVYTVGSAVHGQMGSPQAKDKSITVVQGKLRDEFVREISAGSYHVSALTSKGNVYAWGKGGNGQLGLGDRKDRSSPTLVDALRDRQVEHIRCGPSSTAAICLHKSISSNDQSTCRGCNMAFGITRKKHNCYNCGLLLCRTCCNKKSTNASLAPNKSKPFRVCDQCFNQLQRITTHLGPSSELEIYTPRPLFINTRSYIEENDERDQVNTTCRIPTSSRRKLHEKKMMNNQEKDQNLNPVSSGPDFPRWGQVPCPQSFETNLIEHEKAQVPEKDPIVSTSPVCLLKFQTEPNNTPSPPLMQQPDCSKSDDLLLEEVQSLRNQVESLKKICQSRNEKIQECQQKLEEVWLFAKAEATRRKAAQEVIKALSSRLQSMSEGLSVGRETKDQDSGNSLSDLRGGHSTVDDASGNSLPTKILRIDARKTDSLCNSPIIFSSTSRSLRNKDNYGQSISGEESCLTEADFGQAEGMVSSTPEWVEQYQPGVYITLRTSPTEEKTILKRVRFSRKKFTEKEAQRWWNENQLIVYQKYNADRYSELNQRI